MLTIMTACRSLQMKCTAYTVVSKKFWSITYYIHGVADFVMVVIFVIVRLWLRGYRSLKKGVLKNVSEGARRSTYVCFCTRATISVFIVNTLGTYLP